MVVGTDRRTGHDINNRGQVVGQSRLAYHWIQHAFLWERGVLTDLGTLGGEWSAATAINDRGQVIGLSQNSAGAWHSFLWQAGVMTDLGAIGAQDINNRGEVVGYLWGVPGRSTGAVDINNRGEVLIQAAGGLILWRDGDWTPVRELGVITTVGDVVDINNRGDIVAK